MDEKITPRVFTLLSYQVDASSNNGWNSER